MNLLQPRLNLKITQKQILTPGLVQMVSVLALNKLELKEMIDQEMVENPILEEILDESVSSVEELAEREERPVAADQEIRDAEGSADPFEDIDFGSFFQEYLDPGYRSPQAETVELPSFENFLSAPTTLIDHLNWQLTMAHHSPQIDAAIQSILGNLNETGYLTASLEEIAESGSHPPAEVEEALRIVQECDPAGVAARDLRECLLIQLRLLEGEGTTAWQIVSNHLHLVQNRQHREIARALGKPVAEIEAAVEVIKKLDPLPGQQYNQSQARLIEPDVFIVKDGDEYTVAVNEDDLPQLRVSPTYRRLLDGKNTKEVRNYVKERYTSALHLLKNIEQRKQTIVRVCQAVIRRQRDFLDYGVDYLKPMMIKDVAEEVGVHPSTVSRAVSSKYTHTPQGVFELRYFFSEAVNGPSGGATSLLILKRKVKKMIEQENKDDPLTDDQITSILRNQGINVTRRTVAKYRADMKIPSTHQRRDRH